MANVSVPSLNWSSFTPIAKPAMDFSFLANLPQAFWKGQEVGRENELRRVLGSEEAKAALANGDYNKIASLISQFDPQLGYKYSASDNLSGAFGTPIYGIDNDNGQPVLGQLTKRGGVNWMNSTGQNVTPTKGVQFLNTGTGYTAQDRITGQSVPGAPPVHIDNAGKAADTEKGQIAGQTAGALPDAVLATENAVQTIDKAINDPGREVATGKSSVFDPRNYLPGTEAKSYSTGTLAQVKGSAFLQSVQQMRGLGQLSNAEGSAATAAQTALNTAQTDRAHLQSLYELKALNLRGLIRSYTKAGNAPPPELIQTWRDAEKKSGLGKKVPFTPLVQGESPSLEVAPPNNANELPVQNQPLEAPSPRKVYDIDGNPL